MKARNLAIAGSIAALSFAAAPSTARVDRSRDVRGVRHVDRTPDRTSADRSRDIRDR